MSFVKNFHDWFRERSAREQRMLIVMALVAVPVLLWLLVIRPLGQAREAALERHVEAVDRNGRVRALVSVAKAGPVRQADTQIIEDIAAFVAASAAEQGIALENSQAAGPGSVQVATASVSALAIQRWLSAIEESGATLADVRVVPDAAGSGTVRLTARIEAAR